MKDGLLIQLYMNGPRLISSMLVVARKYFLFLHNCMRTECVRELTLTVKNTD